MPGRKFNGGDYRYGFNSMENDNEIKGDGNSINFGARMYDPRLGRWKSPDAHESSYPNISPYSFAYNNPIVCIDPDGRDVVLFNATDDKVATIKKGGIIYIENGMEDSPILAAYKETRAYFDMQLESDLFAEFENHKKTLNIQQISEVSPPVFSSDGFFQVRKKDLNGDGLHRGKEIISVRHRSGKEGSSWGTIKWNPNAASIDAEGNVHSPAMSFIHELIHAGHYKNNITQMYRDLLAGSVEMEGTNREEEKTINEVNSLGTKCGPDGGNGLDKTRKSHGGGDSFKVDSSTSTEPGLAPSHKTSDYVPVTQR